MAEQVIGHSRVLELLEREKEVPTHAYLFVGADGVGKATVARRFAADLLCPTGGDHDLPCSSCRRAAASVHPDLIVIEAEDGRTGVGVEQAREIATRSALSPVEGARRVFLLPEAGEMTEQAANALLKTLEEPLAPVVFLLVADSEDDLPDTVASRCRTIHFGRVPEEELVDGLTTRGLDLDQARTVAAVSGGRPGLALTLATQPEAASFRSAWLGVPGRLSAQPGDAFLLAEEMSVATEPLMSQVGVEETDATRRDRARRRARVTLLSSGLEILASWYVDSASLQLGGPVRHRDIPYADLTIVTPERAVASAGRVLDVVVDLQANLRPQLLLADLFAKLGES
jgi:DNA polymerase-3 subunit delta'